MVCGTGCLVLATAGDVEGFRESNGPTLRLESGRRSPGARMLRQTERALPWRCLFLRKLRPQLGSASHGRQLEVSRYELSMWLRLMRAASESNHVART